MALQLSTALTSLAVNPVDLALKATVLLLLACGAEALLTRCSAALRHRLWGLAMFGLLLLLAGSPVLPRWDLPVIPAGLISPAVVMTTLPPNPDRWGADEVVGVELNAATSIEPVEITADNSPPHDHSRDDHRTLENIPGAVEDKGLADSPTPLATRDTGGPDSAGVFRFSNVWALANAVWILGSLVCVVGLITAAVRTARWRKASQPIGDFAISGLMDELRQRLNLPQAVPVREHPVVIVPMTWGIVRPVVVLPRHARTWRMQTLRTVLLHELVHVQRLDVAWQLLGRLTCALFWFHPLAWVGLRRMRLLRELACDDAVVQSGERASQYAEHLLEVARFCHAQVARLRPHRHLAVEMTNGGQLEQRIRALFDSSRSHGSVAPRAAFCLAAFSLVCIFALAIIRPVAQTVGLPVASDSQSTDDSPRVDELLLNFDEIAVEAVAGQVLLTEGGPAAGAQVVLRRRPAAALFPPEGAIDRYPVGEDLATTTTDGEGRFEFAARTVKRQFDHEVAVDVDVIAFSIGRSPDWVHVPGQSRVTLTLAPESQLRGQVVDTRGQAVAGATIRPAWTMSIRHLTQADLEDGRWPAGHDRYFLGWLNCGLAPEAITDDNGEFVLAGLPAKLGLRLHVSAPGFAPIWFDAATLPKLDGESAGKAKRPVATGRCVVALAERRYPFTVRVVDDLSGEPIDTAHVQTPSGRQAVSRLTEAGLRDTPGLYDFASVPDQIDVTAETPIEQGYLLARRQFSPATARTGELRLIRGKRVEGRVIDAETGEGIGGVVFQTGTEHAAGRSTDLERVSRTDAEGRFVALLVNDKTYSLQIYGQVPGYLTHRGSARDSGVIYQNVVVHEGVAIPPLEFRLERSRRIEGQVVDTAGRPVANMEYSGLFRVGRRPQLNGEEVGGTNQAGFRGRTDSSGRFSISEPFTRRDAVDVLPIDLLFHETQRRLIAQCLVDPRKPLTPQRVVASTAGLITGRVLDAAGRPLPNVHVEASVQGLAAGERSTQRIFPRVRTDRRGEFRLRAGVPGRSLWIELWSAGFEHRQLHFELAPESADRDLGDLVLSRPRNNSHPLSAPPPDLAGLTGDQAFEKLAADYAGFRQMVIEARRSPATWPQVINSSTLAYATAMEQLADRTDDSDLRLKTLIWILQQSNLSPQEESQFRQLQGKSAARLLANYSERPELAACALNLIRLQPVEGQREADVWRQAAQKLLAANPDSTVQGLAAFAAAEAYLAPRGPDDARAQPDAAAREAALPLLQRVVRDHAGVVHPWRRVSLGDLAAGWLFDLEQLHRGLSVPELEWKDIDGQPVRLSGFQGRVVVVDCCSLGSGGALGESDYSRHLLNDAGPGKSATIVVVYDDVDEVRQQAARITQPATIIAGDEAVRFFRMWNVHSWPTAFVIDAGGKLRAKRIRGTVIAEVLSELLESAR